MSDELVELAAAARRVNRAVRVTDVDAVTLRAMTVELEAVAHQLEQRTHEGPHCQTGPWLTADTFDPGAQPHEYFPYSPVLGPLNPVSPPVTFEVQPGGEVHGRMTLTEPYNGPPWNLAHGGVIAQVFDELLGVATIAAAGGGFTGRLTVHYRKPTPILEELELRGWLDEKRGRKLVARGEIRYRGEVTAEAEGLFVQVAGVLQEHDETSTR